MRNFIDLIEAWDSLHRIGASHEQPIDVDVFRNPNRKEFNKLFAAQPHGLRALTLPNHDLLVWDSYLATHGDVDEKFSHAGTGGSIFLHPDRVELNDIDWDYNDHDPYDSRFKYGRYIRHKLAAMHACPALTRYYGRDFVVIGLDNTTGEKIPMTNEWIEASCAPLTQEQAMRQHLALAQRIDAFLEKYAGTAGDYDPAVDPPEARFTGPDATMLYTAARQLEAGLPVSRVHSYYGSGTYRPWNNDVGRAEHDLLVQQINKLTG